MKSKILKKLADDHKQIIIFGLGREGLSTYRFLRSRLPTNNFILIDERTLPELSKIWTELIESNSQTQFTTSLTEVSQDELRNSLLFKTPGIPVSHPIVRKILDAGSKITSNTQLFFDLTKEYNASHQDSQLTIIGVTGTKGKSTTSSVIYHVLKKNHLDVYLGGNIGKAAVDIWLEWDKNKKKTKSIFILEMSSHQLAELKASPHIAVIQDIVSEHLDYYDDFEQYFQAKTQIARFQTKQDLIIVNQDSKTALKLAKLSKGRQLPFSFKKKGLINLAKNTQLIGKHNLYNVMPAVMIAQLLKLDAAQIKTAIKSFKSLPHRLEFVAKINGVEYYNDSIATVPEATLAALETFKNKSVILIAGGYERNQGFEELAKTIVSSNVKALSLLPPTGQRLLAEIHLLNPCNNLRASIEEFPSMAEAVYFAAQQAKTGDVVLLSPGAASFSTFKDYVDRGNQFKEAVERLKA